MTEMTTPTDDPLVYDRLATFIHVFGDPLLARHVSSYLNCTETNVLVGLLDASGDDLGAQRWLQAHKTDCDEPERH
ncbi:hypothetical protein GCM10012275_42800 [Longimycelium tulufanense]|uniref:Uncharacterized protein n=1 Tax=Longimycelium tulufanense TaxID=907463 RepID=A0A8J3CAZ7_9PSEU|nr:hypothetical protein [Longimycelium tulufanense]GGM67655.1 hypothetical protein GCM10012275_42800 [Longimycelium tulufanense]